MTINRGTMKKAFTLFEMTMALGIFGFVALSVMAVFVSSLRIHRQSSAAQTITDNVRFGLEFMEREMRTGRQFRDAGSGVLEFVNDRGKLVRYRLNASALERFNQDANRYEALTSAAIVISNFQFRLAGEVPGDTNQPRISLFFSAQSPLDPSLVLKMETTVSQRDVDILK